MDVAGRLSGLLFLLGNGWPLIAGPPTPTHAITQLASVLDPKRTSKLVNTLPCFDATLRVPAKKN